MGTCAPPPRPPPPPASAERPEVPSTKGLPAAAAAAAWAAAVDGMGEVDHHVAGGEQRGGVGQHRAPAARGARGAWPAGAAGQGGAGGRASSASSRPMRPAMPAMPIRMGMSAFPRSRPGRRVVWRGRGVKRRGPRLRVALRGRPILSPVVGRRSSGRRCQATWLPPGPGAVIVGDALAELPVNQPDFRRRRRSVRLPAAPGPDPRHSRQATCRR